MRANPNLSRDHIFLQHMAKIVDYVRNKYPGKRILMWDDMLRNMSEETLKWADFLGRSAEPVVWNYSPEPGKDLEDSLWLKYSRIFPTMWIATAFKGKLNASEINLNSQFVILP